MSLLDSIPFASIEEAHLTLLVANGAGEGLNLEFKAAAYGGADDDKREFLKDVTALANVSGGHVIIGMAERNGVADAIRPITTPDADAEKLRLENTLQTSVEPRLVGVQMRDVRVAGGYVLVLRVSRSWNPPHRVTFKGLNRYFLRHSSGVYEPSVDQLRSVFLGGAEIERRLLEFRIDRLARLRTGERGFAVPPRGQLLLQTVPLADSSFVLPPVQKAVLGINPPGVSSLSWRYNLDGLLIYSMPDHGPGVTPAYTQVFHNGRVEMARGGYVREKQDGDTRPPLIPPARVVADMIGGVTRCLRGAAAGGAAFPMAVMISLLDAHGTKLPLSHFDFDSQEPLDRADLLFAPVVIDAAVNQDQVGQALLPILDALWNAFGYERCDAVRNASGDWGGLPKGWG